MTASLLSLLAFQNNYGGDAAPEGPGIVFWICYAAILIFVIISMWKVFEKAGEPGWAAIIPIYNWIVLLKIAGRPLWWLLLLIILFPIIWIIISIDIAKRFGKGTGFGIGLALLGFIFYPILAFGDARYTPGPVPA
jgi:hypothetical protein